MIISDLKASAEALLEKRQGEMPRLLRLQHYLDGDGAGPYIPRSATEEFRELVQKAKSNWLPLVVEVSAQDCYVEGFRPEGSKPEEDTDEPNPLWKAWQSNRLDARQTHLHRVAIGYGCAYAVVLPGVMRSSGLGTVSKMPVVRTRSPLFMTALYDDPEYDMFPQFAGYVKTMNNSPVGFITGMELYDDRYRYILTGSNADEMANNPVQRERHGSSICPVIRFVNGMRVDGSPVGDVDQLLPIQDRITETIYGLLMAQNYSSFKQGWATGLRIPEDEEGNPIMPFNAAVDRIWVAEDDNVRFGQFQETNLNGYLEALSAAIRDLATISQTPPHYFAQLVNISGDTLSAIREGHTQKVQAKQHNFGESWELVMYLVGEHIGVEVTDDAEVIWRDNTPRSLAQISDSWTKWVQMAEVPPEGAWAKIPGVTQSEIARWKELNRQRKEEALADAELALEQEMDKQLKSAMEGVNSGADGNATNPQAQKPATED